ncbi:MAG: alpha-glucosidase C-terminal domain-containing protein [Desulfobacterales bacterium]|nr:MAG: alpha-glucosidase C-terminal domain-containing protein [Desulfobacterales bacterium]
MAGIEKIKKLLQRIYGEEEGNQALEKIRLLIADFPEKKSEPDAFFSQEDVVLITYGDSLQRKGQTPIATLHDFAKTHLKGAISTIHFLPFFPFSSDDGFSVKDFYAIDPKLGSWDDVSVIGHDFQLMFDYVVNHFSSKGQWFENYLAGKEGFQDFAIEVDPATDLARVTRPRSLPLLSEYEKHDGKRVHLWTTFSADQIDFNFKSLPVLESMIDVLLFYVRQGATILRLDAIAYLWKEIGTNCIHLGQTHDMVKLLRSILDIVAPNVMILTETNVPHPENISYFGDGRDEAQMVYNFTLPPLLFYAFVKEDAAVLSDWAKGLHLESETNTFFNFTASHDGIGVRPLEGILAPQEIDGLIDVVRANNGQVSYKRNPDGSDSPYELNITYVDAILADKDSNHAQKFLASQAVQYVLPGVPATYIHSILGSRNWLEGVQQTGRARTINRKKLQVEDVLSELKDPNSFRAKVFYAYLNLIRIRKKQPAFHPNAAFDILDLDTKVFAIKRFSENQTIYALTNLSSRKTSISLSAEKAPKSMVNLISGEAIPTDSINLKPYEFMWLTTANPSSN